jgi:DNA-binding transcriptional LysR family regulator
MFSTRLLLQFVAVAEELHFGRAAARVHMAQSPLSQAIRRLEQNLGAALFTRTKRTVSLTPAGEVFLREARNMLRAEDATVAMVKQAQAFGTTRLSIAFVGNVAYGMVPRLLEAFSRRHPGIQVDFAEMLTREQVALVRTGHLDIAIVRLPVQNDAGLNIRVIATDHFELALPVGHRLSDRASVPLAELAHEPFISYSSERVPMLHSTFVSFCLDEGFYPNIVCQAWQASTILSFVAGRVGVALVPADLTAFRHPGIVYRPIVTRAAQAQLPIAVVSRREDPSPAVEMFMRSLPEVVLQDHWPPPTPVQAVEAAREAGAILV